MVKEVLFITVYFFYVFGILIYFFPNGGGGGGGGCGCGPNDTPNPSHFFI